MGVTKKTLQPGNGQDFPKKGDTVSIHYTGCLYDESKADQHYMGQQYVFLYSSKYMYVYTDLHRFDSSRERGPLKTPIAVGTVIKGMISAPLLRSTLPRLC